MYTFFDIFQSVPGQFLGIQWDAIKLKSNIFRVKIFFGQQKFWSKTILVKIKFGENKFWHNKFCPKVFIARLTRRVNPDYIVFLRKNAWLLIPSHIVHGFGCWERLNSFFVFSGYLCGSFPPSPPLFLSRIPFKPPPPLCFCGCSW